MLAAATLHLFLSCLPRQSYFPAKGPFSLGLPPAHQLCARGMAALPGADAEAPAAVPATEEQAVAARQLRENHVTSLRQRVKDLKQQKEVNARPNPTRVQKRRLLEPLLSTGVV